MTILPRSFEQLLYGNHVVTRGFQYLAVVGSRFLRIVVVVLAFLAAFPSLGAAEPSPDDWAQSPLKRFVINNEDGKPVLSVQLPRGMKQENSALGGNALFEVRGAKGDTIAALTVVEMAGDEGPWTLENYKTRERLAPADAAKIFFERTPDGFVVIDLSHSDFASASFYRKFGPRQVRCDWSLRASAVSGKRLLHWDVLRAACDSVTRVTSR